MFWFLNSNYYWECALFHTLHNLPSLLVPAEGLSHVCYQCYQLLHLSSQLQQGGPELGP